MAGPLMRFRSGAVSATVWENARKDGSVYPSVKLSRSYRDKQTQEWKETSSFSLNELPVVAILARKAFEAMALDHAASPGSAPGSAPASEEVAPDAELLAEEDADSLKAREALSAREPRSRGRRRANGDGNGTG